MALTDEQKNFLSYLDVGRAVVFSQGYEKAIQVQMTQATDTSSEVFVSQDVIHKDSCKYLYEHRKNGVIPGLQYINLKEDEMDYFLKLHRSIIRDFESCIRSKVIDRKSVSCLKNFVSHYGLKNSADYFAFRYGGIRGLKISSKVESFLQLMCITDPSEFEQKSFKAKREKYNDIIRK